MNIDLSHKPLKLREIFELILSLAYKQKYLLPDLLSKLFETKDAHANLYC